MDKPVFYQLEYNINISKKNKCFCVESETERLVIKDYRESDFENSVSLYNNPELTKFFDHGEPRTLNEIREYIAKRGRCYFEKNEPFGIFSIFKKNNQCFIGQVDLVPTGDPGEVEIGWIIHKQFQGQGYCSEAVLDFLIPYIKILAKNKIKTHGALIDNIIATAHPENLASNKMILKAGLSLYKQANRYGGNPRNWYNLKLETNQ